MWEERVYFQPCDLVTFTALEGQPSLEPEDSLPLHFSPAFIPAAPQRSLTVVFMTNQYGLSADTPHCAALEFLNTDPADSPVKVSSQGLHFILYPSLSTIPRSVFSISPASLSSPPLSLSVHYFKTLLAWLLVRGKSYICSSTENAQNHQITCKVTFFPPGVCQTALTQIVLVVIFY